MMILFPQNLIILGVSELHWEDEDSIDPTENKMVKIVRVRSK